MSREKDRKLKRRQRRQRKLRKFKARLAEARPEQRKFLIQKIQAISLYPKQDIPEGYHKYLEMDR